MVFNFQNRTPAYPCQRWLEFRNVFGNFEFFFVLLLVYRSWKDITPNYSSEIENIFTTPQIGQKGNHNIKTKYRRNLKYKNENTYNTGCPEKTDRYE